MICNLISKSNQNLTYYNFCLIVILENWNTFLAVIMNYPIAKSIMGRSFSSYSFVNTKHEFRPIKKFQTPTSKR